MLKMHGLCLKLFLITLICHLSLQTEELYNGLEGLYEKPTTWIAGKNPFPSTVEEMRPLLGVKSRHLTKGFKVPRVVVKSDRILPKTFDARDQWPNCKTIKMIANQGRCGSCWAVAVATSMSDRFCIASKGNISSVSLSAHELTTCCFRCGYGCEGGLPELALDYFHYHGLVTGGYNSREGCQPYNVANNKKCYASECTNSGYNVPFKKDLHKTTKPKVLANDDQTIMHEIMENGPVEACYDVYRDFTYYRGGVYKRTEGSSYEGGHAVRIIGWGEQNGLKYWLCANSWGNMWGDRGTFKILRGSNECQIEDRIVVSKPILRL